MIPSYITELRIDAKKIENFEFRLNQKINDHHHFEILVDAQSVETLGAHTLDVSKEWLGKPVVIAIKDSDFVGIITQVEMVLTNGDIGQIHIQGYSSTFKLETASKYQTWNEEGLKKVVQGLLDEQKILGAISPETNEEIKYLCQYQESDFNFIKRLASDYQEWLYYDGVKLIFGKPSDQGEIIELEYGKHLSDIRINAQIQPTSIEVFSYDSLRDKIHSGISKRDQKGLNEIGLAAYNTSSEVFGVPHLIHSPSRINSKGLLDDRLKKMHGQKMSQLHQIKATSDYQGLKIGSLIRLSKKDIKGSEFKHYGEYMIISIKHYALRSDEYSNEFIAIPSGLETLPKPIFEEPFAQTQMATVFSNEDPSKKGRVQVKFGWQKNRMKSDWLRVLTPDGGQSDLVGTNRGFVFIPEKGDQVMIGFRYNDPDRPFVMGSLFNGSNGVGGMDKNKSKSITTRSGATISFDDDAEKGSITVRDGAGNTVSLDGKGAVSVSANASISLSTGESSISMQSDGTINVCGKNISVSGAESTSLATEKSTFNTDSKMASVNGTEVNIAATDKVDVSGNSKSTFSSSGTTAIEGTIVKLN